MIKQLWNMLYLLRRSPWDTGITPPELVEVIEKEHFPPGKALDMGCGTGTNAIYLAQHGFQTTGIDIAFLAVLQARCKAKLAGVPVKFYTGDVLKLGTPKWPVLTAPCDFVLDIGCFHSLEVPQRQSYVDMLRRVLRIGGFYLLYAKGPCAKKKGPVGLTPEEVRTSLGSYFHDIWTRQGEEHRAPSAWYFSQRLP